MFSTLKKKIEKKVQRLETGLLEYLKLNLQGNQVEDIIDLTAQKRPILLIHGFAGTRRVFTILGRRLAKKGHGIFSIHLGGAFDTFNTRSIDWIAKDVKKKLDRLRRQFGFKEIDIIGHSKGGLIGTYLVKALGYDKYVRNVICLATPHYGTLWAALGLLTPLGLVSKSLRQMVPMSPFLRNLAKLPYPKNTRFVSIYSKRDWICPYPSGYLEGPDEAKIKNIELDDVTHAEFITKRDVFNIIVRELEEPRKKVRYGGVRPLRAS